MKSVKYKAVLLIDDDSSDNSINKITLEASDFAEHIYMNTSALSAIEFLKNLEQHNDPDRLPDIIFLDLDMPLMDGFNFLEEFKLLKSETKSKCCIVILSSSTSPEDVRKSKKYSYVKNYLTKPLTQDGLESLSIGI